MQGNPFGIICAIFSVIIGAKHVEVSWIAQQFGPWWLHGLNAVMGYLFGVSLITFFHYLGYVLKITEAFAKWFVAASISLIISAGYLILQFNRLFT